MGVSFSEDLMDAFRIKTNPPRIDDVYDCFPFEKKPVAKKRILAAYGNSDDGTLPHRNRKPSYPYAELGQLHMLSCPPLACTIS